MLQNIGDKLKGEDGSGTGRRWFFYLILGALALVFMAWGPYAMVDMSFGQSGFAAKVNGEKIPLQEVNDIWQDRQAQLVESFGGPLSDEQRTQFQNEVIEATVQRTVTRQHALEVGYRIPDARIREAFQSEEAFQVDGQFNMLAARSRLASLGISERAYVDDLRRSMLANELLGVIGISDFLTNAEAKRILGLLDEEREVRYLLLQPEDFAGNQALEPAEIETWYQTHAEQFAVPEAVRLNHAELSLADVAASIEVSEEQLRARYEEEKASYVQAETRRASHILITEDADTDDAKAAALAQDLYQQIKGGADFAALARANSKDSASASSGGQLDWAGRDVYVPEFTAKLFSMQEGEISEPVKTQFGYHIIRLDGIRAETGRPFEEVRGELNATLRNELAVNEFNDRQDRLQQQLEQAGNNLDTLAREFGMRQGTIDRFERGAGGLPLGSDADLNREVFSEASLGAKRVGGPVQLGEDRITIFQVAEHYPASTRPLEEVRAEVVAGLIRERGAAAALAAAQGAVQQLAQGRSFEQVAAGLKVKADPAAFVGRGSPQLPVEVRDAVFAAARPTPEQPVRQAMKLDDGSVALLQVTSWRSQPMSDNPQLVALRAEREQGRYTRRDIEAYIAQLMKDSKIRVNPQAFQ